MTAQAIRRVDELSNRGSISRISKTAKRFFYQFSTNPYKIKTHVFKNSCEIKDLVLQAKNKEYRNSEVIYYFGQNIRIVDSQNKQTRLTGWCKENPDRALSDGYGQNEILLEESILRRKEERKLLRWAIEHKETKFGFSLVSSFGFNPSASVNDLKKELSLVFPEVKYETHKRIEERQEKDKKLTKQVKVYRM